MAQEGEGMSGRLRGTVLGGIHYQRPSLQVPSSHERLDRCLPRLAPSIGKSVAKFRILVNLEGP